MQDIVKILDTLSDNKLGALITEAQAMLWTRVRKTSISEEPAIGMWADHDDTKDSAA
jgi:hypothetical protein